MPILTDEDVGLSRPALSDSDVGIAPAKQTFSDSDLGIASPKEVSAVTVDPQAFTQPIPRNADELAAQNFYRELKLTGQMPKAGESPDLWKNITEPLLRVVPNLTGKTVADAVDVLKWYFNTEPGKQIAQEMYDAIPDELLLGSKSREPTKGEKAFAGAVSGVDEAINAFTSPLGIATLGTGMLPKQAQTAISAVFATHMASQLPGETKRAVEAIKSGNTEEAAKAIAGLTLTGTFTGMAGKHAAKGLGEIGDVLVERAKDVGPATALAVAIENKTAAEAEAAARIASSQAEGKEIKLTQPNIEEPLPKRADTPPEQIVEAINRKGADVQAATPKPAPTPAPEPMATPAPKAKVERPHDIIDELEGQLGGKLSLPKARKLISDFKPTGRLRKLFRSAGYSPDIAAQAVGFKGSDVEFLEALRDAAEGRKGFKKQQQELVGLGAATPAEYELSPQTPTSIRNATVDQERTKRGLPPAMQAGRASFGDTWDRAMAKIDQDPSYTDRLLDALRKEPRALTDIEDATLLHRQIELQNEYGKATRDLAQAFDDGRLEDVDREKIRVVELSDRLLDLYNIGKAVGTETGRGLAARKMMAYEDFSLAKMEIEKRAAKGGAPLTDAERQEVVEINKKIETTQKALDEHVATKEKRLQQASLDEALQSASSAPKAPSFDPETAPAKIKEAFDANKLESVTGLVQKLARYYVSQGIKTRDALIDKIHEVLKTIKADITRRETMDAISGYGKYKRLSKDEISKELRDLKGQMQQVAKLEDMQRNRPPLKTGSERRKPSDEERRLIALVNEAKNKFQIPSTDPETQLQSSLDTLKTRLRNQITDFERRLKEKDFERPPKRIIQMDEEANRLHFQAAKAKAAWHEALMKDRLARRSIPQKILGGIGEALNVPRALITSLDFSAVLRQGGFIALGHPIRAAKAFPAMFRALLSEQKQHAVNEEIMRRPTYPLMRQSKLYLAEHNQKLSQMEEVYMSRWATKIPVLGKLVAGSERAYVTFLNRLRADSFDALAKSLSRSGEITPAEGKAIANYVNVATGRGNLGNKEAAAVALNSVFFAPRYVASRFQLLAGQPLYRGTARTRVLIAKEYARYLTGMAILYGLAQLDPDASVETDPRSADFGKIRYGNTRLDPLSGLQQVTVLLSRLGSGETKQLSGQVRPIRGERLPYGAENSADVMARFLRTKLSPVTGTTVNVLSGTDIVGQPVTPESMAQGLLVPLAMQDILKAMEDQGIPRGTALAILSIFGMGLQTYQK